MSHQIQIDQFVVGFSPYDAISNEALNMQRILQEAGYESRIYAEHIHPNGKSQVAPFQSFKSDPVKIHIAIYHFSIGSALTAFLASENVHIILRYHNVTPPAFFSLPSDYMAQQAANLGEKHITVLDHISEMLLADSRYNLQDFAPKSGRRQVDLPILRNYDRILGLEVDARLKAFLKNSDIENWLFVGRVAPNKAQHDLIRTLYVYKRAINPNTRLVLVGTFFSEDYKKLLFELCDSLTLKVAVGLDQTQNQCDVLFLPGATDEMLKTAYLHSDLFLCLSDHEGFCVPLFEAIAAKLPIVAYSSSAISYIECLRDFLVDKKDPQTVINKIQAIKDNPPGLPCLHKQWPGYLLPQTGQQFLTEINGFIENIQPSPTRGTLT